MDFRSRLLSFIYKPPYPFCITVWTLTTMFLGGSTAVIFTAHGEEWWAYLIYSLNILFLLISLFLGLTRTDLFGKMEERGDVERFVYDFGFRSQVICVISAIFNTAYVVFGTVFAYMTNSWWLGALVIYHVILAICRVVVFFTAKKKSGTSDSGRYRRRAYTYCGALLILLAVVVVPVVRLVALGMNSYTYIGGTIAYVTVVAVYSLVKLALSLRNLYKARRNGDVGPRAMKNISFASALISLFALQAVILSTFTSGELNVLNYVVGAAVSIAIAAMGIYMTARGIRMSKNDTCVGNTGEAEKIELDETELL